LNGDTLKKLFTLRLLLKKLLLVKKTCKKEKLVGTEVNEYSVGSDIKLKKSLNKKESVLFMLRLNKLPIQHNTLCKLPIPKGYCALVVA
jgi:hypothetical protein